MLRVLLIVLVVVVLGLGASIGYFNAQTIRFDYLAGQVEMPLIALVVVEFLLVALLTVLVCFGRIFALKSEIRRLRRQLRDADAELKNLRDIPLKDV